MTQKCFSYYENETGHLAELDPQFPSYLQGWSNGNLILKPMDTHFGYCHKGTAILTANGGRYPIYEKSYFCVPRGAILEGKNSEGIVISRKDYTGFFQIGGVVEWKGRLKYIDGCTDSLLVSPVKMGDPCLNLLYFPSGVHQTAHTHPSDRIGMILSGKGRCHAVEDGQEKIIELEAGMIFCIHANGVHNFSTPYGEEMRVLAYHPESDFGPQDEDHPMINRTMIDGVSAAKKEEIHT